MRVAAFGDVHGNPVALAAVLADIASAGVETTVCLGDVAFKGPAPSDCVRMISELGIPCVHGNTDLAILRAAGRLDPKAPPYTTEPAQLGWLVEQLSVADLDFLAGLPRTHRLTDGAQSLLFTHAHPDEVAKAVLPGDPPDAVNARLQGLDCSWLVMGHAHTSYLFRNSGRILINAGAVSNTTDGDWRASYVIIDTSSGGVEFRHVAYSVADAVALAEARGFFFDPKCYGDAIRAASSAAHAALAVNSSRR